MNSGVQYLREHIIQDARIHYAITNTGGFSPNVVQAYAEVLYLIRAPKLNLLDEIYARVNDIARGAALMTGTEVEIDFVKGCSNFIQNNTIEEILFKNMLAVELPKFDEKEMEYAQKIVDTFANKENNLKDIVKRYQNSGNKQYILENIKEPINNFVMPYEVNDYVMPGSTDVGDVTWICPTGQLYSTTWAVNTSAHSWQAVAQGKSSIAHKGTLYAAQVIAGVGVELPTNHRYLMALYLEQLKINKK
jgi:aminobenzoyl-glutamate utilization protein B